MGKKRKRKKTFGKDNFRKPVLWDVDGCYITEAQLQFFLNREDGDLDFQEYIAASVAGTPAKEVSSNAFVDYFEFCRIYNTLWDLMEKDPKCADLIWDDKAQEVVIEYPEGGIVDNMLLFISKDYMKDS